MCFHQYQCNGKKGNLGCSLEKLLQNSFIIFSYCWRLMSPYVWIFWHLLSFHLEILRIFLYLLGISRVTRYLPSQILLSRPYGHHWLVHDQDTMGSISNYVNMAYIWYIYRETPWIFPALKASNPRCVSHKNMLLSQKCRTAMQLPQRKEATWLLLRELSGNCFSLHGLAFNGINFCCWPCFWFAPRA